MLCAGGCCIGIDCRRVGVVSSCDGRGGAFEGGAFCGGGLGYGFVVEDNHDRRWATGICSLIELGLIRLVVVVVREGRKGRGRQEDTRGAPNGDVHIPIDSCAPTP